MKRPRSAELPFMEEPLLLQKVVGLLSRLPRVGPEGARVPNVEHPKAGCQIHSPKLTWKWRRGPYKTTILYIGPSMSFHVNFGGG